MMKKRMIEVRNEVDGLTLELNTFVS